MFAVVKAERVFIQAADEYDYIIKDIVQMFATKDEAEEACAFYSAFSEQTLVVVWANCNLYPGALV